MGQIPPYQRQNLLRFRADQTRDRKRNRPYGWQQQGHLSRTHQPQDILNKSGQSDSCRSPWYHKGKEFNIQFFICCLYCDQTGPQIPKTISSISHWNKGAVELLFSIKYFECK